MLNNIIFHTFSAVSILASGAAALVYLLRSREEARKHAQPWRFLFSPRRNAFYFHIWLFISGVLYQLARIVYINMAPRYQGATVGAFEAFRAPISFVTYNCTSFMVLSYSAIVLSLYIRLESALKHLADRLILWFHRIAATLLVAHLILETAFYAIIAPDWFRLRAWTTVIGAFVNALGLALMGPLIFATTWRMYREVSVLKGNRTRNRELRNSMLKLFVGSSVSGLFQSHEKLTSLVDWFCRGTAAVHGVHRPATQLQRGFLLSRQTQ